MSATAIYDFWIRQGDDTTKTFRHLSAGVPTDLTGFTIQFECSSLILEQDAVILDPTTGEFSITFSKEITEALTGSCYSYNVVFYPEGLLGDKTTKFQGKIRVERDTV